MAMATHREPRTADDLEDMPDDGNRYEIIRGELLVSATPSRTHQRCAFLLGMRMYDYARVLGIEVFASPVDVRAAADTQVEPDLVAVPHEFAGRFDHRWEPMREIVLAVEILSPSSIRTDRGIKRELYLAEDVPAYWIVDTDTRCVEVCSPGAAAPRDVSDVLEWQPVAGAEPLVIDLVALFREVHYEA